MKQSKLTSPCKTGFCDKYLDRPRLTCQQELIECDGTCIDPLTNNSYCGASDDCQGANGGDTCDPGFICSAGSCEHTCAWPTVNCDVGYCVDTDNNPEHCGSCYMACDAEEVCIEGECKKMSLDSCLAILNAGYSVGDGVYTIENVGEVYCDMTNGGWTYEALGFGGYNSTYEDWTLVSSTMLQDAVIQAAFIWAYNSQDGLINIVPGWNSGNCCFKDGDVAGSYVTFGGSYLYPANYGTSSLNCSGGYDGNLMWFYRNTDQVNAPPIPEDYFATFPVSTTTACDDADNPAFFFKRYL